MNCAVKKSYRQPSIFDLVNDVFYPTKKTNPMYRNMNRVQVNIVEFDENYKIDVAAPGLKKEDFNLEVNDQVLTISYESKVEEATEEKGKFIRKEFKHASFKRSFNLEHEPIDLDAIAAKYNQGILTVTLPKTAAVTPEKKTIKVA